MTTETFTWVGGSGNWDTASDWNPLGPPTASSIASIGGTTAETITVENAQAVTAVILDNPKGALDIGGATGATLTVADTVAIEEGSLGIGGLGTLDAAHIRIAAPKGSTSKTNGVLWFPGSGTIGGTVENNGTIKAEGAAGSTVEFERKVIGKGSADISGGGTLEFNKGVTQKIDFGVGGGTLDLLDPTHQSGNIKGFATGDTISLAGDWVFGSLTNPTSKTTDLTLNSGTLSHTLDFAGTFSSSDFTIASGTTSTTIKFA
jgi:hypothetical protein